MEWALGTEGERATAAGGYQGDGVQHAVNPSNRDVSGSGRPLAPCGMDVISWAPTPWSQRTGHLPVCLECERITGLAPEPEMT